MIKLNINNKDVIEITQQKAYGKINVDIMNSKDVLENCYQIAPEDMVMLLNYYQYKTDRSEQIF